MNRQSCPRGIALFAILLTWSALTNPEIAIAKSSAKKIPAAASALLVDGAIRRNEIISIISDDGEVFRESELYVPGASFLKIHFSKFQLPPGVSVEISNPDGSEIYTYSRAQKDAMTFNPGRGDDGVNRFSAMSITGDTALIRVIGNKGLIRSFEHRVEVDYYMEGLPDNPVNEVQHVTESFFPNENHGLNSIAQIQSQCGVDDREAVACLGGSFPTEVDRARPVARLLIDGNTLCTAWRIGTGNFLMSNRHCLSNQADVSSTEVWFGYQTDECGSFVLSSGLVKVPADALLTSNYDLDFTLFSVTDFNAIEGFGHLGIETRDAINGEEIYIPQHGSGNPKEIAVLSDMNTGGYCQIDALGLDAYAADTDAGYFCDTNGGSSGSPVIAANSQRVIALHHLGGCLNQGVSMSLIWPEIAEFFGGIVPTGDDEGPPPNQEPHSQFDVSCSGMNCSFDASSSFDADGSIVSYQWDLGDGTTGGGMNISHVYSSEGSYPVVLIVQDDDGAEGISTDSVDVQESNASPVAVFVVECDLTNCSFDATASYDADGSITTYAWNFGDGGTMETSTSITTHAYPGPGEYLVRLTVTDNLEATGNAESWISVESAPAEPFTLSAEVKKVRGRKTVNLTWSGALTNEVDIFREDTPMVTTGNDGEYADSSLPKRTKSMRYQVCQAGQTVCSNVIEVRL